MLWKCCAAWTPVASIHALHRRPTSDYGLRDYGVDGQLGLEATPDEYVAKMVEVFHELRRVLADHGTLWLNLGDSYANTGKSGGGDQSERAERGSGAPTAGRPGEWKNFRPAPIGLKPKDLIGIPWMVAFALRADGWYLRSDIIWQKPNPMPESITDRPTKSHEYVFLLSKSPRYFYDSVAIQEPLTSSPSDLRKMVEQRERIGGKTLTAGDPLYKANSSTNIGHKRGVGNADAARAALDGEEGGGGRNARSVWTIATTPYAGAHFATMPMELAEKCIKAGTPNQVCEKCGAARERIVGETVLGGEARIQSGSRPAADVRGVSPTSALRTNGRTTFERSTSGWTDCGHGSWRSGVVLDPFAGSGTTLAAARDLGRRSVGIELSAEYIKLIERRVAQLGLGFGQ